VGLFRHLPGLGGELELTARKDNFAVRLNQGPKWGDKGANKGGTIFSQFEVKFLSPRIKCKSPKRLSWERRGKAEGHPHSTLLALGNEIPRALAHEKSPVCNWPKGRTIPGEFMEFQTA